MENQDLDLVAADASEDYRFFGVISDMEASNSLALEGGDRTSSLRTRSKGPLSNGGKRL